MKERVFLISLGCAKNLVDSEHILGLLNRNGHPVVERIEEADLAVINTCAFIRTAVEESIDTILEAAEKKKTGRLKGLLVVGCLVQRYGYKLRREIPEVDAWFGTGALDRIPDVLEHRDRQSGPVFLIGAPGSLADHTVPRVATAPFYSTYLKIAEGCSRHCTYCTIPRLRGPLRSRSPESILLEAKNMVRRGVMEINLVAQDTTLYGDDLGGSVRLEDLLERLSDPCACGVWIRNFYTHPSRVSNRLLDLLSAGGPLCPYLDVPLQHVNRGILKAMGRGSTRETPWHLLERIRKNAPGIAIRTTLMVGFPGETEKIFRELCDFVEWAGFDHLGVFAFSPEEGTAAARLESSVDRSVAEERRHALMALQASVSRKKNRALIGRVVPVLVEGTCEDTPLLLCGRTPTMAPEVDGRVLIRSGQAMVGEVAKVIVREAHPYDLVGEIL